MSEPRGLQSMNGQLQLLLVSDILLNILEMKTTKNDGCRSLAEPGGDMSLLSCFPGWSWALFSGYPGLGPCMFQEM